MRFRYSATQLKFLRKGYTKYRIPELTLRFNARFGTGATEVGIKSAITNHGFLSGRPVGSRIGTLRLFTKQQSRFIQRGYQSMTLRQLTDAFNCKFETSFTEAQIRNFTRNHKILSGRTGHFTEGHKSWNAGTKGQGVSKANSGTFRKGNIPGNIKKVGHERISRDGYIEIKTSAINPRTGFKGFWRPKHVVKWEKAHGPVSAGMAVIFKDGNPLNNSLQNLELVTRYELLRLNQRHYKKAPEQVKPSVLALSKLEARVHSRKQAHPENPAL